MDQEWELWIACAKAEGATKFESIGLDHVFAYNKRNERVGSYSLRSPDGSKGSIDKVTYVP